MSMNLYFQTKTKRKHFIDFPFQTPTELTYRMIEAPPSKRGGILRDFASSNPWLDEELLAECEKMLAMDDLELTYL